MGICDACSVPPRDCGAPSPPICGFQEGLLFYPAPSLEQVHGQPVGWLHKWCLDGTWSWAAPKLSWRNSGCFSPSSPSIRTIPQCSPSSQGPGWPEVLSQRPLRAQGKHRPSVGAGRARKAEVTVLLACTGPDPPWMTDFPHPPALLPSSPPSQFLSHIIVFLSGSLYPGDSFFLSLHPCLGEGGRERGRSLTQAAKKPLRREVALEGRAESPLSLH